MSDRIQQTDTALEIDGEYDTYAFGLEELRCGGCGSGRVKATYKEEFGPNEDGPVDTPVPVMSVGMECKECGETALHVSY